MVFEGANIGQTLLAKENSSYIASLPLIAQQRDSSYITRNSKNAIDVVVLQTTGACIPTNDAFSFIVN